jgi:diguanylate cyclase (GGDEF)-like protein
VFEDITERREADEKIKQLNRVYAVLSGINAAIVRVHDRAELFREACRIAVSAGGFSVARIVELDENGRASVAASIEEDPTVFRRIVDDYNRDPEGADSLLARAIRSGEPMVSNDVASDTRIRVRSQLAEKGSYALALLPLVVQGRKAGVMVLRAQEAGMFDAEEMKLLTEMAGDISFALDHIEKEKRLDYLAYYDALTGLANRTLFVERLNQAIHAAGNAAAKVAVGICDIERLRTINETLGRQGGDSLLKQVAERHARAAGRAETGRFSADQFVTMVSGVKGRSETTRIAQILSDKCFAEPFVVEGHERRVSAKVGIAMFPADGFDAETLLKHAEAALRKGKRTGEMHTFFSADLIEDTAETLTLENKLRQARETGEFVRHYQPKVDAVTRRIVGVEALIRWESPELGLVPPMQFIPLMEETGIILQVGAWALSQAVADHRRWVEMQLAAPRVAVNVSAIQLRRQDFLDTLRAAVAGGATPMGLDLELTESLVMEDIDGNIRKLHEARKLGASIAVDDFGTGYSSLAYLARLPVQTLKIDRSFVITMLKDPDTMALVQTIISLAHSLRLKVVAEGVDQEEQAKVLQLLRCDEMQGYLYSMPLPFDEMTELLRKQV